MHTLKIVALTFLFVTRSYIVKLLVQSKQEGRDVSTKKI